MLETLVSRHRDSSGWHSGRVRVTFDPEANAAYVYFVDIIEPGEAVVQVVVDDDRVRGGEVILDLDNDGRLLGVEILGAGDLLRPETVNHAEK